MVKPFLPTQDIATPTFLMAEGMAVVKDHLNNTHFLARPNVLFVKSVTSQATQLPPAGSGLNKDLKLKILP
jgi:hypothetical protein